jgi:hypothetical protein
MTGIVKELQERQKVRDVSNANDRRKAETESPEVKQPSTEPADRITATDLSNQIEQPRPLPSPGAGPQLSTIETTLAILNQAWNVRPRGYMMSAIDSGWLSPDAVRSLLNTYFYLSHGIRTIDITWRAREQFSPHWGLYEIGILGPIIRVFFPQNQQVAVMEAQLKSSHIYGFFPTVWVAAFVDFGFVGSVVYILIWGLVAGWSTFGTRHSAFATPSLLLVFSLASVLLSPIQGPLGMANSVLVLISIIVTGLAIDITCLKKVRVY